MCFSLEVSLSTGIFCWVVGLYLLRKNLKADDRHKVIALLIFSTIQFADAILWSQQMKKTSLNLFVTSYLIPTILSLQVIYNLFIQHQEKTPLWIKVIGCLIITQLFRFFHGYSSQLCGKATASPIWGGKEVPLWGLIIFLFLIRYNPQDRYSWVTTALALAVAYNITDTGYGSMWCAISCSVAIYYLYAMR